MVYEELYSDRADAGRHLATHLLQYANRAGVLVLALPRGGVPVAFAVAEALCAPLDVVLVRKLGVPGDEEMAMGAIATGDVVVLHEEVTRWLRIPEAAIEQVIAAERRELQRRERAYRGDWPPLDVQDRTVLVIDDGLATGSSMQAALVALRRQQPARLVAAVPVASPESCAELRAFADEVVCLCTPHPFIAVGCSYADFSQTTDDQVRHLLLRAARRPSLPEASARGTV